MINVSEAAIFLTEKKSGEDEYTAEDVESGDLGGEDEPGGEDRDDSVEVEECVGAGGSEDVDRDVPEPDAGAGGDETKVNDREDSRGAEDEGRHDRRGGEDDDREETEEGVEEQTA